MAPRLPGALSRRPTAGVCTCNAGITAPIPTPAQAALCRALKPSHTPLSHTPSRSTTMIRRPKRPYTFTQLVQLTDGSTYTMRTTSPHALYKPTKDSRNHVLWQPSDSSLRNVEVDEAGKLAAFRGRFGRAWDLERPAEEGEEEEAQEVEAEKGAKGKKAAGLEAEAKDEKKEVKKEEVEEEARKEAPAGDALSDLISSYSTVQESSAGESKKTKAKTTKK
ncbi:hypothetical protein AAE478_004129 [Parahypoxylon ruwenzoriense]